MLLVPLTLPLLAALHEPVALHDGLAAHDPITLHEALALHDPLAQAETPTPPTEPQWKTSFYTYWIEPPDDSGYLSGILSADRGQLHLEAHWAYEDRDTLSIFIGKSFPIAGDISGSITPRIGVAGGDSDGIIPAFALGLDWKALSFTTDVEYLIGTSSDTDDFLYSWSELAYGFSERFSAGIVGQRTNVFDQELTIDRGLLFSVATSKTSHLTAYVFNPDQDDPYVSIAFGVGF